MSVKLQWFPGHMHKARKAVSKALPQVDIIVEVLDARIPYSSENPMIVELRRNKPTLKIFNKADLADSVITQQWQQHFSSSKNIDSITINAQEKKYAKEIIIAIKKMLPNKGDSIRIIKAMILGIPNVGKSTLINALANRTIAKTGNEPAVTKTQQRIKLDDNILLIDTPGILWPNIENKQSGYRLAATGGIKETAFELEDVGFFLVEHLIKYYPKILQQRFKLPTIQQTDDDSYTLEILEYIGKTRGCLKRASMVDLDKISRIIINEFRTGKLGKISMETPAMMLLELEALKKSENKIQEGT